MLNWQTFIFFVFLFHSKTFHHRVIQLQLRRWLDNVVRILNGRTFQYQSKHLSIKLNLDVKYTDITIFEKSTFLFILIEKILLIPILAYTVIENDAKVILLNQCQLFYSNPFLYILHNICCRQTKDLNPVSNY